VLRVVIFFINIYVTIETYLRHQFRNSYDAANLHDNRGQQRKQQADARYQESKHFLQKIALYVIPWECQKCTVHICTVTLPQLKPIRGHRWSDIKGRV